MAVDTKHSADPSEVKQKKKSKKSKSKEVEPTSEASPDATQAGGLYVTSLPVDPQ